MTTCTPVSSTDAENAREVVEGAGIIVPINQQDVLQNAMEQLLFFSNWEKLSSNAKGQAENYTWDKINERIDRIY